MPSIAIFIKELLSEEDGQRDEKIQERIKALNAAQLQGMHNHLQSTARKARSPMWKYANDDLLHRIEEMLTIRLEEELVEKKILEELRLKKKQKVVKEREARREQQRVVEMIAETAHKKAEEEVKEGEQKRLAAERVTIMQKVFQAEERRNFYWKVIAASYVSVIVLAVVFLTAIPILIAVLGGATALALLGGYRAQLLTHIVPRAVAPDQLSRQIEEREEVLKKQALMALKEKERKFEEQQRREREEGKRRRAQKREREKFEAELLAKQREEQLRMAQEIFDRSKGLEEGMQLQSLSPSPTHSEIGEGEEEEGEEEGEEAELTSGVVGNDTKYTVDEDRGSGDLV